MVFVVSPLSMQH